MISWLLFLKKIEKKKYECDVEIADLQERTDSTSHNVDCKEYISEMLERQQRYSNIMLV